VRLAVALSIVVVVSVGVIASAYHVFSQTADEPVHLRAGLRWLQSGEYDVDLEHPPLARIFFALDPFFAHATGDGNALLERDGRYVRNLSLVRAPNLLFFALAVFMTGIFAARLFGVATGVLAAALFAFMPNVLAHAGLATTVIAATAFVIAALSCLTGPAWLLGLVIGFGLVSKFSFPVFFIAAAIPFVRKRPLRDIAIIAVIAFFVVWAVYRFDVGTLRDARGGAFIRDTPADVASRYAMTPGYEWVRPDLVERYWAYARQAGRNIDFVDWAKAAGYPSPKAGRHGDTMAGAPPPSRPTGIVNAMGSAYQWIAVHLQLPAPRFLVGLEVVGNHATGQHPAFLLGRGRADGWWYYFPVVFFFKTPIPLLILLAIGFAFRETWRLTAAALLMLIAPMFSTLDIGVRHILPIMPLVAIIAAYAPIRLPRAAAIALLLWLVIADVRAYPDYLAYFNAFAGDHPERIASDSNLDWGQDLLRLKDVVRERGIRSIRVAYFGSADVQWHIAQAQTLKAGEAADGWIAVSEMMFTYGTAESRAGFAWLNALTPKQRVGRSIRLYFVAAAPK